MATRGPVHSHDRPRPLRALSFGRRCPSCVSLAVVSSHRRRRATLLAGCERAPRCGRRGRHRRLRRHARPRRRQRSGSSRSTRPPPSCCSRIGAGDRTGRPHGVRRLARSGARASRSRSRTAAERRSGARCATRPRHAVRERRQPRRGSPAPRGRRRHRRVSSSTASPTSSASRGRWARSRVTPAAARVIVDSVLRHARARARSHRRRSRGRRSSGRCTISRCSPSAAAASSTS